MNPNYSYQQLQQSNQDNGIRLDLDKDSIQVLCTVCPESSHSIFHCPVLGPRSLIVVEPILSEIFVAKIALDFPVTLTFIRDKIASACHMLPRKTVLTTQFLEPLVDDIELHSLAQTKHAEAVFPKVIYALMRPLASSVRRELMHNTDLAASLEAGERALALLPQWLEDLVNPHVSFADIASSPTTKRAKAALVHAINEIESVLPELIPKPEEIVSLINSIYSRIDRINHPVSSMEQQDSTTTWLVPIDSPLSSTHPIVEQQLPHDPLVNDPPAVLSQPPVVPLYSKQPSRSIPPSNSAAATEPVLSRSELMMRLTKCDDFADSRNLSALIAEPLRLFRAIIYPCSILFAERRQLLIQVARHQLGQVTIPYKKEIVEHVLILLQLFQLLIDQGDKPFTDNQWLELQQLASSMTPTSSTFMFRHAILRNLLGLPPRVELTSSFDNGVGFGRFRVLANLVVSFGLTDSSMDWVSCTLDALEKAKRVATKWSVYNRRKASYDARVIESHIDTDSAMSDFRLDDVELCSCIPWLFREILPAWLQATGTCEGRISSALKRSRKRCHAAYCLKKLNSRVFKGVNYELYIFIDLCSRFLKLKPASTRQERAYAAELTRVLDKYNSF